jgi:hypothetical protein
MTLPYWTPPLTKLRVYEAFYLLNRSFEATIQAVDRLERLEFFEDQDLSTLKTRLEHIRAGTNQSLIENMAEYEGDEEFRFEQVVHERQKENSDPDDVFFAARARREEIKNKMKRLQDGLNRQRFKSKTAKQRPTRRKRPRSQSAKKK